MRNEVKPDKNISNSSQSFLEIFSLQKEVPLSHMNSKIVHISSNPFKLKEGNSLERNCQKELNHLSFSHIKQEYEESLIHGNIYI